MKTRHTLTLTEEQRQATLLALALLSIDRPGWHMMLGEIAALMDEVDENGGPHIQRSMFERFRALNSDRAPKPVRGELNAPLPDQS
jgi:hypothetical protein